MTVLPHMHTVKRCCLKSECKDLVEVVVFFVFFWYVWLYAMFIYGSVITVGSLYNGHYGVNMYKYHSTNPCNATNSLSPLERPQL